jgi:hypothetical protein
MSRTILDRLDWPDGERTHALCRDAAAAIRERDAALAECRRDLARIDAITAASGDPAVVAHQPEDGMLVRRVRDLAAATQEQAAEVDRLRAALDAIRNECDPNDPPFADPEVGRANIFAVADAAIRGAPPGDREEHWRKP